LKPRNILQAIHIAEKFQSNRFPGDEVLATADQFVESGSHRDIRIGPAYRAASSASPADRAA
jgi:hypothetical protein